MTDDKRRPLRFSDIRRMSRYERRMLYRAFADVMLIMIPVALLGNFSSEFFQQGDWVHFAMAVAAALMLLAVFWLQYFRR